MDQGVGVDVELAPVQRADVDVLHVVAVAVEGGAVGAEGEAGLFADLVGAVGSDEHVPEAGAGVGGDDEGVDEVG